MYPTFSWSFALKIKSYFVFSWLAIAQSRLEDIAGLITGSIFGVVVLPVDPVKEETNGAGMGNEVILEFTEYWEIALSISICIEGGNAAGSCPPPITIFVRNIANANSGNVIFPERIDKFLE
jgi:hypothetical protein